MGLRSNYFIYSVFEFEPHKNGPIYAYFKGLLQILNEALFMKHSEQ
jgi:hypothetical protein